MSEPVKTSDSKRYSFKDFSETISKFRFMKNESDKHYWEHKIIMLPEKTKLKFEHVVSSEKNGPEKHKLILFKNLYYTTEIFVETFGASGNGVIPNGIPAIAQESLHKCKTFTFEIKIKSKFERITAGNPKTEEYIKWTDWLITRLEDKFSIN